MYKSNRVDDHVFYRSQEKKREFRCVLVVLFFLRHLLYLQNTAQRTRTRRYFQYVFVLTESLQVFLFV